VMTGVGAVLATIEAGDIVVFNGSVTIAPVQVTFAVIEVPDRASFDVVPQMELNFGRKAYRPNRW
jgi:uridine phosphorylase